ncbi:MAG TPA: ferrochelatase, partial [Albitalea sp.]
FAWQSAGSTGEPWLGPDIVKYLTTLHAEGTRAILSVPIGFLCDHLEVLYDIDHEAVAAARALGMTLRRTRMPNATPELIKALVAVVAGAERANRAGVPAGA